MRMNSLLMSAVACLGLGFGLAAPAVADGPGDVAKPHHTVYHRVVHADVHRRGLWPGGPDPYAYSYARSAYYPYYDSRQWVPISEMRHRTRYPFRIPEYYAAWGYPLTCKVTQRRNCGVPYHKHRWDVFARSYDPW